MSILQRSLRIGAIQARRNLFTSGASLTGKHVHSHEHIPLSRPHKLALTVGSALASLANPARGDMIALLSELSGEPMLPRLRDMITSSEEGRLLLMERPVINTKSIDMKYLESLPETTFGKQYWNWLRWCNVGPDTRAKVRRECGLQAGARLLGHLADMTGPYISFCLWCRSSTLKIRS
jgi:hypothetical protein